MSEKNIIPKKVGKNMTTLQICNELKIIGYYRIFIYNKYKGKEYTLKEWKSKLESDGLELK